MSGDTDVIRVLESFPSPRPTTNPYIVMLLESLQHTAGVEVSTFSWRTALLGRYDVIHLHWPEALFKSTTRTKLLARQLLFTMLLLRLAITGRPIVRTVHNLELPTSVTHRERLLLRVAERMTTLRIALTPSPADRRPQVLIPHGHYRDWFVDHHVPAAVPGRLAAVGLIRRYKALDSLIAAFRELTPDDGEYSLHVSGSAEDSELAQELSLLASDHSGITLRFEFITDEDLVTEIGQAELVVLPYREMRNSGGALTALSLGRAVLMPDNDFNRRLRDEAGPDWVYLFDGVISRETIIRTIQALRAPGRAEQPQLDARDWRRAGVEHLAAYRRALELSRHRLRRHRRAGG
jgi:glycosyltransferase involved in cell wall biosynthesis